MPSNARPPRPACCWNARTALSKGSTTCGTVSAVSSAGSGVSTLVADGRRVRLMNRRPDHPSGSVGRAGGMTGGVATRRERLHLHRRTIRRQADRADERQLIAERREDLWLVIGRRQWLGGRGTRPITGHSVRILPRHRRPVSVQVSRVRPGNRRGQTSRLNRDGSHPSLDGRPG